MSYNAADCNVGSMMVGYHGQMNNNAYNSNLFCAGRGAASIDGRCICPGTKDTMPYMAAQNQGPEQNAAMGPMDPVGHQLVMERKPPSWHYQS